MKKRSLVVLLTGILVVAASVDLQAQCSICTKTAQQLGEGPAAALNFGILYLAMAPLSILGFIGYKWYKNNMMSSQD